MNPAILNPPKPGERTARGRQYNWHCSRGRKQRYAYAIIGKENIRMHRFILGASAGRITDHKNMDGLDNRRDNLRNATPGQNAANNGPFRHNTSGYRGVTYDRFRNKWRAEIRIDGRDKHLGRFGTKEEAAMAYDRRAKLVWGEFAKLNLPDLAA
jgi:hypothetical protein